MKRLLVVNGPNLNLLGNREREFYGSLTLDQVEARMEERARVRGCELRCFQSNSEAAILDFLQAEASSAQGLVLNPGGLTHTSVALYDCLKAVALPTVEVHLSNIFAREEFRSRSVTAAAALGVVAGLGASGYIYAMEYLIDRDE